MNSRMGIFKRLLLMAMVVGLAGCASSTKLTNSWSDPDFSGAGYKRVLVLGIMDEDLQRRTYEDAFVARIAGKGDVVGIAGYTLMSDPDSYDEESEIRAAVEESGADAALLATLVEVKQQQRYVPPRVDYMPTYGFGYGFYDYYGRSYNTVYRPGYTTTDTIVKLETTVFDTANEKMVWAGETESFNPKSAEKVVNENADLIFSSMRKGGLL